MELIAALPGEKEGGGECADINLMQIYLQPPCIIQLETTACIPVKVVCIVQEFLPRINCLLGVILFISFPVRGAFMFIIKDLRARRGRTFSRGSYPVSGLQARKQI